MQKQDQPTLSCSIRQIKDIRHFVFHFPKKIFVGIFTQLMQDPLNDVSQHKFLAGNDFEVHKTKQNG